MNVKIKKSDGSNTWVNISQYIAFQGLKRDRNDVDGPEAGRTMDGTMVRARVATKYRWDVTCRPLTTAELKIIEDLITPETIKVRIDDPQAGLNKEMTMYSNNTSAAFCIRKKDGTEWWNGVTFPLIEV